MGATTFETTAVGRDFGAAFTAAVRDAQYDYGHAGYTGTIAEKDGADLIPLPKGVTAQRVMAKIDAASWAWSVEQNPEIYNRPGDRAKASDRKALAYLREKLGANGAEHMLRTYDDKWGPAIAFELTGAAGATVKERAGRKGTHDKVFIFCGWASC